MMTDVRGITASSAYKSISSTDAQLCRQLYLLTESTDTSFVFRKHINIQHILVHVSTQTNSTWSVKLQMKRTRTHQVSLAPISDGSNSFYCELLLNYRRKEIHIL